jgi:hypothetical protein
MAFHREYGATFRSLFDVIIGTATVDPGSILDGDETAGDVTVTGAAIGDFVLVAPGVDPTDLTITATVTAADTVTWVVANNTGGTLDLASSTWNFTVLQPARLWDRV